MVPFTFLVASVLLLASSVLAFPQGGAPVCLYEDTNTAAMQRPHGKGVAPRATMVATQQGAAYSIALTGIRSYKGLIMWVRDAAGTQHVGQFTIPDGIGMRGKDCTAMSGASSGAMSTMGHFQGNTKTTLAYTWTPDAAVTPGMQLVAEAVVVENDEDIWYTAIPGMFIAGTPPAGAGAGEAAAQPTPAPAAPVAAPAAPVAAAPSTTKAPAAKPATTKAAAAPKPAATKATAAPAPAPAPLPACAGEVAAVPAAAAPVAAPVAPPATAPVAAPVAAPVTAPVAAPVAAPVTAPVTKAKAKAVPAPAPAPVQEIEGDEFEEED